jgi:serine/threonine-protein kinase
MSPGYPQALDDVCARALARAVDERFDTAAQFAEALEQAAQPLGIATPKQVGAYVRETSGKVIDDLMRRVRAFQEGSKLSPAPIPRLELADNPDSAVRPSNGATPVGVAGTDLYAFQARKPLVVGVVAALLVLVGAIIATVAMLYVSSASQVSSAPSGVAALPPQPAMTTTAAPTDSSPSISVTELPHPIATPPQPPSVVRRITPIPVASVTPQNGVPSVTAAAIKPPPVIPASPTSSAFNPESM